MAVQTQIQARRGTAATWTSTNPTLAAGETGYETDTGRFKIGTGSTAWASLAYFNRDPLTTKGDLYTFSTTDDRLAVGANGETLVADSSTATGLRYQGTQAAGRNAIINGGFDIWQRGTSSTSQGYVTADRWYMTGASTTFSQETSDLPTGFRFALKCTMSGTAQPEPILTIETQDSIRFAGQTVVLSYYVKTSNSTNAVVRLDTSNNVDESVTGTYSIIATNSVATTTSWTRVSATFAVPSTSRTLRVVVGANGNLTTGQTILISGVQLELGSVATTFTRTGGTIQGELAACQRYYQRINSDAAYGFLGSGKASGTGNLQISVPFQTTMRTIPSALDTSAMATFLFEQGATSGNTPTTIAFNTNINNAKTGSLDVTKSASFVIGSYYWLLGNNTSSAYLGFSAEL